MLVLLSLLLFALPGPPKSNLDSGDPGQSVDGTSPERTAEVIALGRYHRQRRPFALGSTQEAVSNDRDNISVIEDDGTILTPVNRLDLANRSIIWTPAGAGYSVVSRAGEFDDRTGATSVLALADDDTVRIDLPFAFTFYGIAYTSIFVNSDGNLTFVASDFASTERNLGRMANGPPRVAPLFDDLNPSSSGRVSINKFADRVVFTWTEVGEWATGTSSTGQNTFQAVLSATGAIQFNYRRLDAETAVVGIAPGKLANAGNTLVDFSTQTTPSMVSGLIAEIFATRQAIDLTQVTQTFYRTHPDSYDGIVVFSDFALSLGDAFAFALPVRNGIAGIMNGGPVDADVGLEFGSRERLSVVVNMGDVTRYPSDPGTSFLGTDNSLSILGQEFGHRWLAYLDIGTPALLGRDDAHWSFLHNTYGSVMEGNEIQDLGGGNFRTVGATVRYSPLDQYLMGLRPASQVPPWFVVMNPSLSSTPANFPSYCRDLQVLPSCAPFVGLEFSGTRRDVRIDDIIATVGPRVPAFEQAQKDFRVAFLVVTQRRTAPKASTTQFLGLFRTQWQSFFGSAVDGRGTMNTDLLSLPPQISSIFPAQGSTQGGTAIVISGSGFQPDATVTIGGHAAATTFIDAGTLWVTSPPRSERASVFAAVVVRNPRDGQVTTFASGFLYVYSGSTEVRVEITANGSHHIQSNGAGGATQVGYTVLDAARGVSVVRFTSGGEVRSEAAIPAATIATSFRVFAERTATTSTGLALLNIVEATTSVTAQLSDGRHTTIQLPARSQKSQFIQELFPDIGTNFTGTLSLTANVPIGLVALRGSLNQRNDFLITTAPATSGLPTSETMVFPQIADGSGYVTELILINPATSTITGMIDFSFSAATDRGTNTRFLYEIPPGEAWKLRTSGARSEVQVGFAALTPTGGSITPPATAILKQSSGMNLNFEAGVPAVPALTHGVMFGIVDATHRSVLAIVNRGADSASVRMTSYGKNGAVAAPATTILLASNEHRARFLDELIPNLPRDFEGTVVLESAFPVYAITLRTMVNASGAFLMTSMPLINLDQTLLSSTSYFPQFVDGGNYTTEFLLLNSDSTNARLQFFNLAGEPLPVSLR